MNIDPLNMNSNGARSAFIAPYLRFLERVLTPGRLRHSLGVMQVTAELAEVYGYDPEQALLAGLLHDAAKDLPPEQIAALLEQGKIPLFNPADHNYVLYQHGPVGAWFVAQELGLQDATILDCIARHTFYGPPEDYAEGLVWCLRFADLLEPNRDFRDVPWLCAGLPRLRAAAYAGRMEDAAFTHTSRLIAWFEATGITVHPNIRRVRDMCAGISQEE